MLNALPGFCVWSLAGGVFCWVFLYCYEGGKAQPRLDKFSKEELQRLNDHEQRLAEMPNYITKCSIKGGLAIGFLWLIYQAT